MHFLSISAVNLRCLAQLSYRPGVGVNLVYGSNGSGKTSLLEAFSLASVGKSFLSNRALDIVKTGSDGLSVRAEQIAPPTTVFAWKSEKREARQVSAWMDNLSLLHQRLRNKYRCWLLIPKRPTF